MSSDSTLKIEHMLIIPGRLPGLNEYTAAQRSCAYKGAEMKRTEQKHIELLARSQLRGLNIKNPVELDYTFYEKNKRRDHDNVSGFAHKVIQDALVAVGILKDDGWDEVISYSDKFKIDPINPRIVLRIWEVQDGV